MDDAAMFDTFVRASSRDLVRAAWLLTGNWARAEDLVRAALNSVWARWSSQGVLERSAAYAHRVLIATFLRWRRRRWNGEIPTEGSPERSAPEDDLTAVEVRGPVLVALASLPSRQRAVVVMRYFLDLSEADTAMAMGYSVGWVTSQPSRALARLRAHPALQGLDLGEHGNGFEDRLTSLLQQAAPEPAAVIDPSTVRTGTRRRPRRARWDGRWRWAAPAIALVVVLAASASGCAVPRLQAAPAAGSAAPLPVGVSCPATAVTVDQQRAAATGASAVPSRLMLEPKEIASSATAAQASRDGMVSLIVNPDGQPQWRVMGFGVRLPDQASARDYAIL